jgi:hypothetical protein
MMKMRVNSYIPVIVICLNVSLLVGCQTAEQRLLDMSEGISTPPETVLLASQSQSRQGSQNNCYFTSLFNLYGSSLTIGQIIEYYTNELIHDDWVEVTPSWFSDDSKDTIEVFQHDKAFQIAFSEALADDIYYLFGDIQWTAESYKTSYLVTLTYADTTARRDCPTWNFETNGDT